MYKYYPKYQNQPQNSNNYQMLNNNYQSDDERLLAGGFLGPFVLGGITGGLVAPYFYRPYQPYPYQPYPPYPYRPRW